VDTVGDAELGREALIDRNLGRTASDDHKAGGQLERR
jgi:hypothetical protein